MRPDPSSAAGTSTGAGRAARAPPRLSISRLRVAAPSARPGRPPGRPVPVERGEQGAQHGQLASTPPGRWSARRPRSRAAAHRPGSAGRSSPCPPVVRPRRCASHRSAPAKSIVRSNALRLMPHPCSRRPRAWHARGPAAGSRRGNAGGRASPASPPPPGRLSSPSRSPPRHGDPQRQHVDRHGGRTQLDRTGAAHQRQREDHVGPAQHAVQEGGVAGDQRLAPGGALAVRRPRATGRPRRAGAPHGR